MIGGLLLLPEFRNGERELFLGCFGRRFPAGERVGEVDGRALALRVVQRLAEVLQDEDELQMRDDVGCGQEFKAEEALLRGLLHVGSGEHAFAARLGQGLVNLPQHLDEIRAGAAAGVEDEDARVGETVGDVQFLAQHGVHAGDHVFDNLRRGVPDAQFLAQRGIERLEERLVEILHGVGLDELREEGPAVHAVERGGGPVEHFHQAERAELRRRGDLLEQGLDHRDMERPRGGLPVEGVRARGVFLVPQHPRREDPVEERLHERGAEEVLALVRLELHAQRLLQRGADGGERGQIPGRLDAGAGVAGVGGEKEGDILGIVQRRGVEQDALEVFGEAFAEGGRRLARVRGGGPERGFAGGEAEGFQADRRAAGAALEQAEVAVVAHEHLAVMGEVVFDLLRLDEGVEFLARALHFEDAARGLLPQQRGCLVAVLELVRREQPAVGDAGAAVFQLDEAANLGLERGTHRVEENGERRIAGGFLHHRAAGAAGAQVTKIDFEWLGHRPFARRTMGADAGMAEPVLRLWVSRIRVEGFCGLAVRPGASRGCWCAGANPTLPRSAAGCGAPAAACGPYLAASELFQPPHRLSSVRAARRTTPPIRGAHRAAAANHSSP